MDYEQLEEDYNKLLEKVNCLLLENFELKKTHRIRCVSILNNIIRTIEVVMRYQR